MSERSDKELDRLLAQGRFARPEQERVLENVLDAAAPKKRGFRAIFIAIPVVAALAAIPLLLDSGPAFRSRGATDDNPGLRAGCAEGCKQGSKILFETANLRTSAYFAAFAQAEDGSRIWYFPSAKGVSPAVEPHEAPRVFAKAASIGPEHDVGTYEVQLILLAKPLTRKELLSALNADDTSLIVSRQAQQLEVGP